MDGALVDSSSVEKGQLQRLESVLRSPIIVSIDLHSANSQNLDILGNIEILARTCPVKMARMVTLVIGFLGPGHLGLGIGAEERG